MAIQQLTRTHSFTIEYDDASPSAHRRALALASTVERDAATLFGWFGVANPLDPGNRCTVRVTTDAGLGVNWGYHHWWYGTLIEVSPLEGASNQALADDFARALFVAEFAEVLMDVRANDIGHRTWNAGDSAGEALSVVCAELLYQDACLRSGQSFPRASAWIMSSDWPDWVSHIDGSDQHFVTFGCGILFIAYLLGQLGKTIGEVVQAEGTTLEEKFQHLTGRSGGYAEMKGVLSQYFPRSAPGGALRTDFPFPLLPAARRTLALSPVGTVVSSGRVGSGQVPVELPFPCHGTIDADYTVTERDWHLRVTALPTGFANPTYTWLLHPADGSTPVSIDASGTSDMVEWSTVVVDPDHPTAPPAPAVPRPVRILAFPQTQLLADTQAPIGVLELDVTGGEGEILCSIECRATDGVVPETTTAETHPVLDCRLVEVDDEAVRECRNRLFQLSHNRIPPYIHRILPDPPPDLRAAIFVLRDLAALAERAARDGDGETVALVHAVVETLGLPRALSKTALGARLRDERLP